MQSSEAREEIPSQVASRYTVIDRIGTGAAGVVYRARDEVSGRIVALKRMILAKGEARGSTLAALFEREYHTLARLKHPRIIEALDYGLTPEGPYYTMELLDGSDLRELRQLPYAEVCRHLRDIASSLALLHAQRLVHRDVSPRNIRLTADGTARLLDFGAVATFGKNSDVIGTPPFMAPEVLQQLPLDPRTDLYSLGAVGYFCLTGQLAFPARHVSDLPRLWQTPPVPPSALSPDIPAELDRLILSMLSPDPLGRPQMAASVIDELTVIGRLPPEAEERAEQSYFLSSPLVGRGAQMDWIAGRLDQALAGKGCEVLIEGHAGIGKTRMADELCLAGTLKGTVTLKADAESTRSGFGVAIALGRRLLEACPDVARRAAEPHEPILRKLSPELAEALGGAVSGTQIIDPADYRMRCHAALREWFLTVSRERTLLVAVDNLHAADDDSASFLSALGRESRSAHLFVLSTLRIGSAIKAPEALRAMRERAQRLKLASLDAKACERLASDLFGGAVNAGRLGNLLYQRSGGAPRQFIDLAQYMVRQRIVRYEAGGWLLPLQVAESELPARGDGVLAARLSHLGVDALGLAQALAVHKGAVPLAVALSVSDLPGEGRTHAVLDALLAEQVLVSEDAAYRFSHEAIREGVLSTMDPDAVRQHQLRAAEALLAFEGRGVAERVEAALLLVDAGEEQRGARTLITAARDFAAGAGAHQNSEQLVSALCRMVRAYDAEGRSDYELGALLFPTLPLAYYSANYQFILQYGERAIDIGLRITGLARAMELAPQIGPEKALQQGLGLGAAGFAEQAKRGVEVDLKATIAATIGMVPACMGVYAACFDEGAAKRIATAAQAFTLFGPTHVGHAVYLFASADSMILGRESESRPVWEQALAALEAPACSAAIGDVRARALQGGVLFTLGVLDSYCVNERALEVALRMEKLGVKTWIVAAHQLRILYHSLRGESAEAKVHVERLELSAVQGAQTWQAEVFWPALLLNADVLTGDTMAARRRSVQLERRAKEITSLKRQAEAAHAAYLLLRGDVREAIAAYEQLVPRMPHRECVDWETTRSYFARALNAAGEHARARAVAEDVLAHMLPSDEAYIARFLEARRQLALAESGLGNHERASALIDSLLAQLGSGNNHLIAGILHQARWEVAQRAGDRAAAETHLAAMTTRFRATQNPLLIAQCERAQRSMTARWSPAASPERHRPVPMGTSTHAAFGAAPHSTSRSVDVSSTSLDPLEAAAEGMMRRTRARSAYLYSCDDDDLQLAWSSTNGEAPSACKDELQRWLHVVRENEGTQTGGSTHHDEVTRVDSHRLVALRSPDGGAVVGGLVLEMDTHYEMSETTGLLDNLGKALEESGADELGFITA